MGRIRTLHFCEKMVLFPPCNNVFACKSLVERFENWRMNCSKDYAKHSATSADKTSIWPTCQCDVKDHKAKVCIKLNNRH